jgi:hypothetical protein
MENKRNVWLLPTDKPSRLGYLTKKGKEAFNDLRLFEKPMPNILDSENQHIYITNDEKIKLNDYVIQTNFEKTNTQIIQCVDEFQVRIANDKDGSFTKKKIIITDNKDLLKDGVQEIDDEFLEWFVNNPSCEEVEIKRCYLVTIYDYGWKNRYQIIIPQEEPKQECCQDVSGFYLGTTCPKCNTPFRSVIQEPKQETLEEVAERNCISITHPYCDREKEMFFKGAKWEQQRMYSDIEQKWLEYRSITNNEDAWCFKEWLVEQFKKK